MSSEEEWNGYLRTIQSCRIGSLTPKDKRSVEHEQLTGGLRGLGIDEPQVDAVDDDPPDGVLTHDGERIGIELTELHPKSERNRIALRHYRTFPRDKMPTERAEQLEWVKSRTSSDIDGEVSPSSTSFRTSFKPTRKEWSETEFRDEVRRIIDKKSEKTASKRSSYDRLWLFIIGHTQLFLYEEFVRSSFSDRSFATSVFDKVWYSPGEELRLEDESSELVSYIMLPVPLIRNALPS